MQRAQEGTWGGFLVSKSLTLPPARQGGRSHLMISHLPQKKKNLTTQTTLDKNSPKELLTE